LTPTREEFSYLLAKEGAYQIGDLAFYENGDILIFDFDRHVPRKPRPLGRGKGAQYKRKLPYREAPPFRAGSFT